MHTPLFLKSHGYWGAPGHCQLVAESFHRGRSSPGAAEERNECASGKGPYTLKDRKTKEPFGGLLPPSGRSTVTGEGSCWHAVPLLRWMAQSRRVLRTEEIRASPNRFGRCFPSSPTRRLQAGWLSCLPMSTYTEEGGLLVRAPSASGSIDCWPFEVQKRRETGEEKKGEGNILSQRQCTSRNVACKQEKGKQEEEGSRKLGIRKDRYL